MAICRGAVTLWQQLKGKLPEAPAVLEIGEANWFGDVPLSEVPELAGVTTTNSFEIAKLFYAAILGCRQIDAVDREGASAFPYDLNKPLPLLPRHWYDIVISSGTTEHIFDQRQVFQTIHEHTRPGGVMVHCFPVAGCTDHGFYTYSPCLIRELAKANHYELLALVEAQLNGDVLLHLAWRKTSDAPFVVPQQQESRGVMGGVFKSPTN